MRIRLAILDDNPFVELPDGTVHPRAATFHRFAEAVVAAGPFERADYLVPVTPSAATSDPATPAVDPDRLRVVPTSPFDGIAGYLRSAPRLARRNWPVIRDAVAGSDLVWIKTPASNAVLAAIAARRAGRPFFTWVAGSARAVVKGQSRPQPAALAAAAAALMYDSLTGVLRRVGPAIELDAEMFTSLVTAEEIAMTRAGLVASSRSREAERRTQAQAGLIRLAWAGRVVRDKGLDDLLRAIAALRDRGRPVTLDVVGDGPERSALARLTDRLRLNNSVRWCGYVADREAYLGLLRGAELFVLPSRAEGLPKVVLDAMAAGLPIVATRVGALPQLLESGRLGRLVLPGSPRDLAQAIEQLMVDKAELRRMRDAGLAFATDHTIETQAAGLVAWMRQVFSRLPWPDVWDGQA